METVYLTRKVEFSASHRYWMEALSPQENLDLFGKCSYPHGHGHNYLLEVTVKGEVDPRTGMVINLSDLDRLLKAKVVDILEHHEPLPIPAEVKARLKEIVAQADARHKR